MTSRFVNKNTNTNQKGFSHHFLLPVLAVLLVAGIGGYVMLRSSSAATNVKYKRICGSYIKLGSTWKTCGTEYPNFYKGKSINAIVKVRIRKLADGTRVLDAVSQPKTYKFDSGKTTVKVSFRSAYNRPVENHIWCSSTGVVKAHKFYPKTGANSQSVKLKPEWKRCVVVYPQIVTQYGPRDGYVNKVTTEYGPESAIVHITL